ncbi:MAG: tyrosine-type recombinase/integrase [Bacteroidales bacterium]|nr:tyrosine-type recombinase/integrase [Bacteroidales bacterium]
MTFSDIYALWREEKAKTVKPASFSTYVLIAESYVLPYVAEKTALAEADMLALQEAVREAGNSDKTAYDAAKLMMGVLRFGAQRGMCPMPSWKLCRAGRKEERGIRILSAREQAKLLEYIYAVPSPRNIGLYLALTTGITMGELCHLTWQDIDLKAKVLHVRGNAGRYYKVDAGTGERTWVVKKEEEAQERAIPLAPPQVKFLGQEEGKHRPETFLVTQTTCPVDPRVVRNHVRAVFRALDLREHQFKDLRHSFAVRCLETGCDFATLGFLLGVERIDLLVGQYRPFVEIHPRKSMEQMISGLCQASPAGSDYSSTETES